MRLTRAYDDERGTSAVEFGLTAPIFFMMLLGTIEIGLLLWTQLGLQHGAELAARCASVNSTVCADVGAIQRYASQMAFGLDLDPSTFNVTTAPCGNQVSATYAFPPITTYFGMPTLPLSAQACFPK